MDRLQHGQTCSMDKDMDMDVKMDTDMDIDMDMSNVYLA
jgi:hypothetical protein